MRDNVRPSSDGVTNQTRIPVIRIGKTVESIDKGGWGDVQFYRGRDPETLSASSEDPVSCYSRMAAIDDDRWVYVYDFPNWREVVGMEC